MKRTNWILCNPLFHMHTKQNLHIRGALLHHRLPGGSAARVHAAICSELRDPPQADPWASFLPEDWRLLVNMVHQDREGLGPLLYWQLEKNHWSQSVPPSVRSALAQMYYNTVAHNALLFSEYHKLADEFNRAMLPFVPIKGIALAQEVYPHAGLRPMGDLDLLVPASRADEAVRLAAGAGYTPAEAEIQEGINAAVAYNAFLLGGEKRRIGLELHWNLMGGAEDERRVPMDWFWRHMIAGERHELRLEPSVHLLYLTAHLMIRHGGYLERMIWFVDLDRLIRSSSIDWALFASSARQFAWGGAARLALEKISNDFGTPIPEGLADELASGEEWEAFLTRRRRKAAATTRFQRTWMDMRHLSMFSRIKYLLALVFPSYEYMRWRYRPKNTLALLGCYPARWFDALRDGWRSLVKR